MDSKKQAEVMGNMIQKIKDNQDKIKQSLDDNKKVVNDQSILKNNKIQLSDINVQK